MPARVCLKARVREERDFCLFLGAMVSSPVDMGEGRTEKLTVMPVPHTWNTSKGFFDILTSATANNPSHNPFRASHRAVPGPQMGEACCVQVVEIEIDRPLAADVSKTVNLRKICALLAALTPQPTWNRTPLSARSTWKKTLHTIPTPSIAMQGPLPSCQ